MSRRFWKRPTLVGVTRAKNAGRKTRRRCFRRSRPSQGRRRPVRAARREPARSHDMTKQLPDNFYERIKPRLHKRIGQEVRLARRVLDLGCGSCDLVRHLAGAYGQEVTGVDISPGSFPSRRRTPDGTRFHCLKRNAAHLSFVADGSADAVVTMWALHEMEKPRAVLRETRRVLRPGGEIFIVDFPKNSLAQRLWHEDYYRPNEVRALLQEAGFEKVRVRLIRQGQVMWARGYRPPARQKPQERRDSKSHVSKA